MAVPPGPAATINVNKAHAGGMSVAFGEQVAQVVVRYLTLHYPTFVDEATAQSLQGIVVGLIAWLAIYYTPSSAA